MIENDVDRVNILHRPSNPISIFVAVYRIGERICVCARKNAHVMSDLTLESSGKSIHSFGCG